MSVAVFCSALIKLQEELEKLVGYDFPKIMVGILKICIETTQFDDFNVLDGKYSNATLGWIAQLRNSDPFINLTLDQERLVFKTLQQILKK